MPRLDLTPADIFKSMVIGDIEGDDSAVYADKWEQEEQDLGREGFAELFGHVRMIFAKERGRQEWLLEFEQQVLNGSNAAWRRAAFIAVGGWVDSRSLLERLASKLTKHGQLERRFYSAARNESGTPPPNHEQVRGLFNSGAGLIVHTGHGQANALGAVFFDARP